MGEGKYQLPVVALQYHTVEIFYSNNIVYITNTTDKDIIYLIKLFARLTIN